jgi:glycosyltransferase involved in cell wall biosynthesis
VTKVSTSSARRTVAHILPFPSVGGTEHATRRIAQAVDSSRFRSIAFCLRDAEPVRAFMAAAGLPCTVYEPAVHSYTHAAAYLRASLAIAREFRRQRVDLVHCADLLAAHHAALAGRLAGVPVICHVRNRFDTLSWRDRSFLWPVQRYVFVSRHTWQRFACDVPPARGVVVYDGIDAGQTPVAADRAGVRRELGIPDQAPVIGMMARVAPQKDFATLARAAALVLEVEPDARFVVAGDHSSPENRSHYDCVRRDLDACNVARSFIFTGYREDVPRLLSAIDVVVLSTHWEGLPLVLIEAMAHAKPVVATSVDGIPEVVRDGETGLLFPHRDHVRFASHLIGLLRDRARATALGEAGRHLAQTCFSVDRFAAGMNDVYTRALSTTERSDRRRRSTAAEPQMRGLPHDERAHKR